MFASSKVRHRINPLEYTKPNESRRHRIETSPRGT